MKSEMSKAKLFLNYYNMIKQLIGKKNILISYLIIFIIVIQIILLLDLIKGLHFII